MPGKNALSPSLQGRIYQFGGISAPDAQHLLAESLSDYTDLVKDADVADGPLKVPLPALEAADVNEWSYVERSSVRIHSCSLNAVHAQDELAGGLLTRCDDAVPLPNSGDLWEDDARVGRSYP